MFIGTVDATIVVLTGTLFCVAIENDSALMMVKSGLAWGGLVA